MTSSPTYATSLRDDRERLEAWFSANVSDWPVGTTLDGNDDSDNSDGTNGAGRIDVVVTDIRPVDDRRVDRDLPTRLRVTYLAAPAAADSHEANSCLVRLLAAAPEQSHFEIVNEPISAAWWLAMGAQPRPCAQLRTTLLQSRVERENAPLVTEPLVVQIAESKPLSGVVTNDTGRLLAGASVVLVGTGQLAETDKRGRFTFPSVALDRAIDVAVRFKGDSFTGTILATTHGDLLVTCQAAP